MLRIKWAAVAAAAIVAAAGTCAARQATGKEDATAREKIAGVWRGNSVCVDKNSACHDEVNVYRFSPVAGKTDTFKVTASRVVDGKEIEMGTGEFKYDEKAKTVESEKPRIRLTLLRDNWLEGALRLDDDKEYRKIRLKKEN